ncbi:hypothetical protein AN476_10565 [Phaeobacter sp. 11ANDIMAR09]|nr:hypothetical protein AN476_10565 [Phaeobacter sp. 11ANDIMAR09]
MKSTPKAGHGLYSPGLIAPAASAKAASYVAWQVRSQTLPARITADATALQARQDGLANCRKLCSGQQVAPY